ncbi:MAG: carbamate kinase [Halopenitus sp.]
MPRAIVALGGNTLLRSGEGTVAEQRERLRETRAALRPLRERDDEVVFTHGNGPQVGNRLLAEEESSGSTEPLDVIGAETQAQVGYLLQGAFGDAFGPDPAVVVTRTRVDPDDPAFETPTKPIGPYYTQAEAAEQPFETTEVHRDGETAYRRVVPSPKPASVLEIDRIRTLARDDAGPVICGGGGGVPVVAAGKSDGSVASTETEHDDSVAPDEGTRFEGVAAVIDKDHTSRLVAEAVDADELLLLTDVDAAYVDYGTEDQRPIGATTPPELREYLDAGEFAAGSMQPKVEASVDFVEAVGGRAIITSPDKLADGLRGEAGTRVTTTD